MLGACIAVKQRMQEAFWECTGTQFEQGASSCWSFRITQDQVHKRAMRMLFSISEMLFIKLF